MGDLLDSHSFTRLNASDRKGKTKQSSKRLSLIFHSGFSRTFISDMTRQIKNTEFDDIEYNFILKNERFKIPDFLIGKYLFLVIMAVAIFSLFIIAALQQQIIAPISLVLILISIGIAFIFLSFFIISSFKRTFYFERFATGFDLNTNVELVKKFFLFYGIEHFPEVNHPNIFFSFEQKGRVRYETTFICIEGSVLFNSRPQKENVINTSIYLKITSNVKHFFRKIQAI